ncbi:MAG: RNA-binding S4 domain-containing protein [candidate division WS1 bacterium]|jgi:ribosomal 50S subunit-recycling heat shock protein|nr:RNA-binding S4 domain-containing protein [candidate division WS1 bacterium]
MRLDKYLKNVGIVKRRTLAKRLSDEGNIQIDGRRAKPSSEVKPGNRIRIQIGMQIADYEVLALVERPVPKADRDTYARLLHSERARPLGDL